MISRWIKYLLLALLVIALGGAAYIYNYAMSRLAPRPSMLDSPTTFVGFNHIGISVHDLDEMLAFYQEATAYELVDRYRVAHSAAADALYGQDSISYETAILRGPNMLLELTAYDNNPDTSITMMPPQGPGMTHTCYQSPLDVPAYGRFRSAGARILSRGDAPVEVGSSRVSYAYGYDPEGNMMELEHMPDLLIRMAIGTKWAQEHPMWMTQVALISPDLKRLTAYYQQVLEIEPYRVNSYPASPYMDAIVDIDSVTWEGAWFGMDRQGKKLELMQYTHPATPVRSTPRRLTDLGYSYSYEVEDIQQEYQRLLDKGVAFVSAPQQMKYFWTVYAQDPDGNVYALRQIINPDSPLSLLNM